MSQPRQTEAEGLHAVVIAGGSGTRFWPLSRRHRPKQLLNLAGEESLLGGTFSRVSTLVRPSHWWMVVGQAHAQGCREAAPQVPTGQVLVEPAARNTAPAIGLAALHLRRRHPGSTMVVLPADHHVADPRAFCDSLACAARVAAKGGIVTLGIAPTHPETGYGYIQRGAPLAAGGGRGGREAASGAFAVARFCEKPDLARAAAFLADGNFFWNAGIFVMQPEVYLSEVDRQLPQLYAALMQVEACLSRDDKEGFDEAFGAAWRAAPNVSIDYGVMENAQSVAVVPASCGWSDVGSWSALGALISPDAAGNVVHGQAVMVDSKDCVVSASPGHMVGLVGVQGMAVVHTPDATLVVPKARAQEVRAILEGIGANGWEIFL